MPVRESTIPNSRSDYDAPMPRRGFVRRACIALLAAAGLVACERSSSPPSPPPPAGVVPDSDRRIIALSPAAAISLVELGLQHRIVGRHAFDLCLDPAIPVAGDQTGLDFERLMSLKPTDIVIQWGQRELPPRLLDLARDNGWRITPFNPLSLDEIRRSTAELAAAFPESAAEAQRVLAAMDEAWRRPSDDRAAARASVGRVLLLISVDPPAALGPGSFHHEILERIGGRPALISGGPYQRLDREEVLRLAPDAIVLIAPRPARTGPSPTSSPGPSPQDRSDPLAVLGPLREANIPAVRSARFGVIDDPLAHTPSTAMLGLTREMCSLLDAWAR